MLVALFSHLFLQSFTQCTKLASPDHFSPAFLTGAFSSRNLWQRLRCISLQCLRGGGRNYHPPKQKKKNRKARLASERFLGQPPDQEGDREGGRGSWRGRGRGMMNPPPGRQDANGPRQRHRTHFRTKRSNAIDNSDFRELFEEWERKREDPDEVKGRSFKPFACVSWKPGCVCRSEMTFLFSTQVWAHCRRG